jgi:hypothetical protein
MLVLIANGFYYFISVEEEVSADSAVPKKGKVLQDLRVPKKDYIKSMVTKVTP